MKHVLATYIQISQPIHHHPKNHAANNFSDWAILQPQQVIHIRYYYQLQDNQI